MIATLDDSASYPPADSSGHLREYTVIGLRDNTSGTLTVAGVVAGRVDMVDADTGSEHAQRWAQSFLATDPGDAENQAHDAIDRDDD